MANVVNIKITADDLASDKIEGVDKKSKGLSERLSNMRGPLLAAGAALTGIGVASIKLASDLEEARAAAETTFKSSFGVIQTFAEEQADAFNISKSSAFEYTAQLGGIFNATGLAADESANASVEFVKLAADLASFKNLRFEEALEKIRAGLVGEAEPLRTVGVLLSAARVEQVAYSQGIAAYGAELTEAQKVQARQIIIMTDLADAQGDVARTSDSVANQMRDVQQRLADVTAELGTQLLPAVATLLGHLSSAVKWFGELDEDMKTVILAVGGVTAGMVALGLVIPPLIGLMTALGVASNIALAGIPLAIAGITAGITLLILKWDEVKQFFNDHAMKIAAALAIIMPPLSLLIATVRLFSDGWKNAVNDIIDTLNNTLLAGFEGVLNQVRSLWNKIPDWLRPGPEWEEVNLKIDNLSSGVKALDKGWTDVGDTMDTVEPRFRLVADGAGGVTKEFMEFSKTADTVANVDMPAVAQGASNVRGAFEDMMAPLAAAVADMGGSVSVMRTHLDGFISHEAAVQATRERSYQKTEEVVRGIIATSNAQRLAQLNKRIADEFAAEQKALEDKLRAQEEFDRNLQRMQDISFAQRLKLSKEQREKVEMILLGAGQGEGSISFGPSDPLGRGDVPGVGGNPTLQEIEEDPVNNPPPTIYIGGGESGAAQLPEGFLANYTIANAPFQVFMNNGSYFLQNLHTFDRTLVGGPNDTNRTITLTRLDGTVVFEGTLHELDAQY